MGLRYSSRWVHDAHMAQRDRIYRRTWAGERAWQTQDPRISPKHHRVLGLVGKGVHGVVVRASLQGWSEADVDDCLTHLERSGALESVPLAEEDDLDFTGNFHLAAIRAELEKLKEKSEKIAQLLAR
jgi:hypothetical protein